MIGRSVTDASSEHARIIFVVTKNVVSQKKLKKVSKLKPQTWQP